MFALSQQLGNSEGIEMTGDAITAVARRVAEGRVEAQQKAAQDAILVLRWISHTQQGPRAGAADAARWPRDKCAGVAATGSVGRREQPTADIAMTK